MCDGWKMINGHIYACSRSLVCASIACVCVLIAICTQYVCEWQWHVENVCASDSDTLRMCVRVTVTRWECVCEWQRACTQDSVAAPQRWRACTWVCLVKACSPVWVCLCIMHTTHTITRVEDTSTCDCALCAHADGVGNQRRPSARPHRFQWPYAYVCVLLRACMQHACRICMFDLFVWSVCMYVWSVCWSV
jgi:hypothetical protein